MESVSVQSHPGRSSRRHRNLKERPCFSPPLILPPLLVYRNIGEYNFLLAQNLLTKSFPRSLRVEEGEIALVRSLFFKDPDGSISHKELGGSVLQLLVEKEGGKPDDTGRSPWQLFSPEKMGPGIASQRNPQSPPEPTHRS